MILDHIFSDLPLLQHLSQHEVDNLVVVESLLLLLDDLGETPPSSILCMGLAVMRPSSELLFLAASRFPEIGGIKNK